MCDLGGVCVHESFFFSMLKVILTIWNLNTECFVHVSYNTGKLIDLKVR